MAPAEKKKTGEVIGIDLGTTFSCVVVSRNGKAEIIVNDQGNRTTPSSVAFTNSNRLVDEAAKNQAALNPRRTIFDAKRLIVNCGGKPYVEISTASGEEEVNKTFSPEEISAMILRKMKETEESYLRKPVAGAVITVSAYFKDMQRQATKDARTIAGLDVLRIINEPTVAAIAYGLNNNRNKRKKGKSKILVYDLGGGTFDVNVLEVDGSQLFRVLTTGGDTHLGGGDFDQRVLDYFMKLIKRKNSVEDGLDCRTLGRLRKECERAKRVLSCQSQVKVEIDSLFQGKDFSESLTRAKFDELNLDLFKKTMKVVRATLEFAKLKKGQIEEIVLVGGSTRVSRLREMLMEMLDRKEPNRGVNPDEAVAYGVVVLAFNLRCLAPRYGITLHDVAPLSLGINVVGDVMSVLIPRNTSIPTKMSQIYHTSQDNQTTITFRIFQGERVMTKDCLELGRISLRDLPPAPRGVVKMNVTFKIDANGILSVLVEDNAMNNSKSFVAKGYKGNLTEEEVERMVREAKQMAEEDKRAKERVEARNRFERYIYDVKGALNNRNIGTNKWSRDKEKVEDAVREASEWLDGNGNVSKEEYEKSMQKLADVWNPIIRKVNA
ncbi:unnamed protein product [Linum tenue]|uniref:Uncharacterized protein n=1 Tax=Linum tenue TaxID=586396 RepID=A0AAV0IRE5_9ROSI|nr:unnamed protein product [Linum tenue]